MFSKMYEYPKEFEYSMCFWPRPDCGAHDNLAVRLCRLGPVHSPLFAWLWLLKGQEHLCSWSILSGSGASHDVNYMEAIISELNVMAIAQGTMSEISKRFVCVCVWLTEFTSHFWRVSFLFYTLSPFLPQFGMISNAQAATLITAFTLCHVMSATISYHATFTCQSCTDMTRRKTLHVQLNIRCPVQGAWWGPTIPLTEPLPSLGDSRGDCALPGSCWSQLAWFRFDTIQLGLFLH